MGRPTTMSETWTTPRVLARPLSSSIPITRENGMAFLEAIRAAPNIAIYNMLYVFLFFLLLLLLGRVPQSYPVRSLRLSHCALRQVDWHRYCEVENNRGSCFRPRSVRTEATRSLIEVFDANTKVGGQCCEGNKWSIGRSVDPSMHPSFVRSIDPEPSPVGQDFHSLF